MKACIDGAPAVLVICAFALVLMTVWGHGWMTGYLKRKLTANDSNRKDAE